MPLFGFSTRMHFMRADLSADVSVLLCLCACSVGTGQGLTPVNGVSQVGVMDMLRFHKFTIGWNWIADYGSSDDADGFRYLAAYSPLHNLTDGTAYPATLITTADHDDRVVPAHSFKFAARLQQAHRGPNPVLIRIETQSGHGSSSLTKQIAEMADEYAFMFEHLGMEPTWR